MVTIKASYNVIPKEPTPIVRLELSDNDQMLRRSHVSTIYVYNTNPNLDAIERMSESLSNILVNYYPIAGRLSWIEGGRLELNCNAKGALLLEAESTKTLDEYGDFSPNDSIKELTPSIDYSQPLEEIPLLVVQLTRFHCGKGVAIGVAISHPLGDGFASTRFINTWAKVSRGDKLNDEEKFPFLDRSIIKSPHPPLTPRFEHPEFKGLPLKLGSIDSKEEQKKKLIATTLKLTSNQVKKLKNKANEEKGSLSLSRSYSRFESIAAHIWRCACKARELDENQPTRARFNVDVRNRLNPPLPPNYFGNAVAPTVSPLCYVGEIMSKPLSFAAQMIREGSELITNDYIRSQQDFVRGHEEMDGIRPSFKLRGEDNKNNAPFYGNPNINFVILMRMPWGEVDFGWGKPMYFGPSLVCPTDKAILIDSDGDGSVIISMHFQEVHMELFTKFFWQDI
ncbi:Transferase [Sesbania bispinosa]|nr:Transferase [Sesbania bispinosa]